MADIKEYMNSTKVKKQFKNSIFNCKPIFFHFLDGFLNEEGYTISQTHEFLKTTNIINNFFKSNHIEPLLFLEDSYDINKYKFYDMLENKISIDIINDSQILIDSQDLNKSNLDKFKKIFNYTIYHVGNDKHATCLVWFIKLNKLHILSFNSGDGIKHHKSLDYQYFLPYMKLMYTKNIISDADYKEAFYVIRRFITINKLYKFIGVYDHIINRTKNYIDPLIINKVSQNQHISSETLDFIDMYNCLKIISLNNFSLLNRIRINIKSSSIRVINIGDSFIENFAKYNYRLSIDDKTSLELIHTEKYYDMLKIFFDIFLNDPEHYTRTNFDLNFNKFIIDISQKNI